jgi:hypothetical protein
MPTGIEMEVMKAQIDSGKALIEVAKQLKRIADRLEELDYMGTLPITNFNPDKGVSEK